MKTNDSRWTYRDAVPDDAASIAAIYNESVTAGSVSMDEELWTEESVRALMAGFNSREVIMLALGEAHEILGWGIVRRYSDRVGYRFTAETSVYVWRRLMGQGLGSGLKKMLIERCRAFKYHHLVAKVLTNNKASLQYNVKFGYKEVGVQREVGFKDGRWQDVTILQLILEP